MERKPQNIFEKILFDLKIVNDNVVALADNLSVVNDKISQLFQMSEFTTPNSEEEVHNEENEGNVEQNREI